MAVFCRIFPIRQYGSKMVENTVFLAVGAAPFLPLRQCHRLTAQQILHIHTYSHTSMLTSGHYDFMSGHQSIQPVRAVGLEHALGQLAQSDCFACCTPTMEAAQFYFLITVIVDPLEIITAKEGSPGCC